MKKMMSLILLLIMGSLAFAIPLTEVYLQSPTPKLPKSMGMGGSFRVFSTGEESFFGNPAGLAAKDGGLVLLQPTAWVYINPSEENIDDINLITSADSTFSEYKAIMQDFIAENGFGGGMASAFGWAGKGVGVGFTFVTDNAFAGSSLASAEFTSTTQISALLGLGFPVRFGPFNLRFGADVRGFFIADNLGNWDAETLLEKAYYGYPDSWLDDQTLYGGFGVAFDAGATLSLGPLMVGAMLRDIGLDFQVSPITVGELASGKLPRDDTYGVDVIMDPILSTGAGFQFNLFNIIAPSLFIETDDTLALFEEGFDDLYAVVDKVHAGAEVKLLNFLSVRAGVNRGWLSMGAGLNIGRLLEADVAFFVEEMSDTGDFFGRAGLSAQATLKL
jgi:hypothetical protein